MKASMYAQRFCVVFWHTMRRDPIPWAAGFLSLAMGAQVIPAIVVVILTAVVLTIMGV
jgi:hypothetical protein